jgi:signal transduction histidine kinase
MATIYNEKQTSLGKADLKPQARKERYSPHVLVAEDDPEMRKILRHQLRQIGCTMQEARHGLEALQILVGDDSIPPIHVDVLIADVWMPLMSGVELLRNLRVAMPELPVILLSANATIDSSLEALNNGAFAFLTKPYEWSQLRDCIDRAMQESERRRTTDYFAASSRRINEIEQNLRQMQENPTSNMHEVISELLTGLRHELGNLATAMRLNLDQMRQIGHSGEEIRENLDDMQASVDDLTNLMERFREYPHVRRMSQTVDLRQLVGAAVDSLGEKIPISAAMPEQEVIVQGAAAELTRVFTGLMENAAENSQTITVSLQVHEGNALILLEDDGPGFPEEVLVNPFSPSHTTKLRSGFVNGLALGLFMAKMVITLHQGQIMLSNLPGHGAQVVISLPLANF